MPLKLIRLKRYLFANWLCYISPYQFVLHKQTMHTILVIFIFSMAALFATSPLLSAPSQNEQPQTSAVSKYKTGQIIAYFDSGYDYVGSFVKGRYYQKYLRTTSEGYYLIQDFYKKSNKKRT